MMRSGEPLGVRDDHAAHLQAAEVQRGAGGRGHPNMAARHRYGYATRRETKR